jgi:hypothetical protein
MNHTPPEKPLRVWRITRVKGQYLGRVQAADATAAIEAAVKLFKVAKMHRSRLLAEPVGEIRNVSNREVVQVAALQLKLDRSQATAQERADFDAALARMSNAELMALSLAAIRGHAATTILRTSSSSGLVGEMKPGRSTIGRTTRERRRSSAFSASSRSIRKRSSAISAWSVMARSWLSFRRR